MLGAGVSSCLLSPRVDETAGQRQCDAPWGDGTQGPGAARGGGTFSEVTWVGKDIDRKERKKFSIHYPKWL